METISDIEILYTVFNDYYDDESIDAVYLMAGCDFNYAYDMLNLPFETNDLKIKKPKNKKKVSVKKTTPEYYETKKPTQNLTIYDFMKNKK
jgi:hypothetical protein